MTKTNLSIEKTLHRHGLRNTEARHAVLLHFFHAKKALSHQDLDQLMPECDRVTLYRTLRSFEEKGLIHRAVDSSQTAKYALCHDQCDAHHHEDEHAHFHCNGCGTTFCVEALQLPQAPKVKGARVEQVYLVLEGKCAECQ